mmetsp:Transcript_17184/g.42294  ORF Transcript_17184/g.42294 Transcript_17184/m.42294 type:complete len:140 (+) Transcript_17184:267-686(+)
MASLGPAPKGGDKGKKSAAPARPLFVQRFGRANSEWKLRQGEGWDPGKWSKNLETRGARWGGKKAAAPVGSPAVVEPVYSDPTAVVPGGGRGQVLKEKEMLGVWRAQEAGRRNQFTRRGLSPPPPPPPPQSAIFSPRST